jgi:hypothetical protein
MVQKTTTEIANPARKLGPTIGDLITNLPPAYAFPNGDDFSYPFVPQDGFGTSFETIKAMEGTVQILYV